MDGFREHSSFSEGHTITTGRNFHNDVYERCTDIASKATQPQQQDIFATLAQSIKGRSRQPDGNQDNAKRNPKGVSAQM